MLGVKKSVDPVARRRAMLRLYTSVIAGVALTVIVIVAVLSLSKRNDTLAVIANLLGAGTPILALLAGFVALQAYAVTTGLPDLKFRVFHEFGEKEPARISQT